MNKMFSENFDDYIKELFTDIDNSLEILRDRDLVKSQRTSYLKALKYIEWFFWRKTKNQRRAFSGVESYINVNFFLYPLKNLIELSKKEGDNLPYYQNEIIKQKSKILQDKYLEKESEMKETLKGIPESII